MQKSRAFWTGLCGVALLAPANIRAQTRVDVNGEMVNANPNPGQLITAPLPISWNAYSTGGGGGMVGRWDVGGSSDLYGMKFADEDDQRALLPAPQNTVYDSVNNPNGKVGRYPGTHSLLIGGNGTTTAGTYGISQSYTATPGMVYWLSGGQGASADWSGSQQAKYAFDYGVETGTGVTNGQISTGNIRRSGGVVGLDGRFSHAVVATGNQVTSHVGMRTNGANTSDINAYVDGLRVYEIDASFNPSLVNGKFEAAATDISRYDAKGNPGAAAQNDLLPGWVPLGGAAGQRAIYNQDSALKSEGTYSFQFALNKGNGRMYAAQRVKLGGAGTIYDLTGMVRADTADSNARIGIDPTGGLDPNSASVVWSTASALNAAFNQLSVMGVADLAGNGVTVFLGAGTYNSSSQAFRLGGDFGARFDDIVLTPEPTTIGLLALGSLLFVRRRRAL